LEGTKKYFFQLLGPLLACLFWFGVELDTNNHNISLMAGIALWMCTWWFTEAVSLAVTALVPVLMLISTLLCPISQGLERYSVLPLASLHL
jgi:sodium-dependent dicarboxylate transporter 2/3/5